MTTTREVRIGCVQTPALPTFDEAIEAACRLAGDAVAAGAELVCLPEYCGGLKSENGVLKPPAAPEASHPVLEALRGFTRDARVWMLIGSVAVDGPEGRLINRGFLVDDKGEIRARYDKIHLFDVDLSETERYRESAVINPGGQAVVTDTPWGRLGMTTCYDLRFPHLYRSLAQAGAEILAVPAAFMKVYGTGTLARAQPRPGHRERRRGGGPLRRGPGTRRRRRLRPLAHRLAVGRGPGRGRRRRQHHRRHRGHGGRRQRPQASAEPPPRPSVQPAGPAGTGPPLGCLNRLADMTVRGIANDMSLVLEVKV